VCLINVQLHYTFPRFMLLQEPLLVIAAFYLLFLLVIIYVRMDFAISKVPYCLSVNSIIKLVIHAGCPLVVESHGI